MGGDVGNSRDTIVTPIPGKVFPIPDFQLHPQRTGEAGNHRTPFCSAFGDDFRNPQLIVWGVFWGVSATAATPADMATFAVGVLVGEDEPSVATVRTPSTVASMTSFAARAIVTVEFSTSTARAEFVHIFTFTTAAMVSGFVRRSVANHPNTRSAEDFHLEVSGGVVYREGKTVAHAEFTMETNIWYRGLALEM
jgi:hypothetical protein